MNRRELLAGLAALICAQDLQAQTVRHVAVLYSGSALMRADLDAFLDGMQQLGWVEGRNVKFDIRFAEGHAERFAELAADAARRKPEIIFAGSTPGAQAAKAAAGTIPVVIAAVSDPVGSRIVPNLAHPGGNVTGLSLLAPELSAKRVDIIKQTLPGLRRLGVLWNLHNDGMRLRFAQITSAAPSLGLEVFSYSVRNPEEFEAAFRSIARQRPDALLVMADPLTLEQRVHTVEFAQSHRLPAIYEAREFVDVGGLLSYGINFQAHFRRAASYVDRILKGANPGDLPVEQPAQFELVVNLKAARALGMSVPRELLFRADQVIE